MIQEYKNGKFSYKLYVNVEKLKWEDIKKKTKCYGLVNLGYYDMNKYSKANNKQKIYESACAGLIVNGETIKKPIYHEYGICIDKNGNISCDVENSESGKLNYCIAQPPVYINNKIYCNSKLPNTTNDKNGATWLGFKENKDLVILCNSKDNPVNSKYIYEEFRKNNCVNILRYDGSWSSQGDLGENKTIKPSQTRIVHNYLLIYKNNVNIENPTPDSSTYPIPNRVLSKGRVGEDVKWLQYQLNKIMNCNLDIDGSFGNACYNSVIDFQRKYGLSTDGSVGDITLYAILEWSPNQVNNIDKLIEIAKKEIGTKEYPANSNKVKYNTWYYGKEVSGGAYPWCVAFQNWCMDKSNLREYFYGGGKCASCSQLVAYHKKLGQVVYKDYKRGDFILFDFNKNNNYPTEHIGLCTKCDGKYVTTIDGNTGVGNEANGGAVMERTREIKYVVCAIRWDEENNFKNNKYLSEIDIKLNVLQKGCFGELVKILQILLNSNGENCGDIDGFFGSQVESSLKLYQAKNNLTSDGSCGSATWNMLLRGE